MLVSEVLYFIKKNAHRADAVGVRSRGLVGACHSLLLEEDGKGRGSHEGCDHDRDHQGGEQVLVEDAELSPERREDQSDFAARDHADPDDER